MSIDIVSLQMLTCDTTSPVMWRLAGGGDGEHSGLHSYTDLGLNDCLSEVCLREHLELTLDDREWERERAEWVVRLWSSVGSCLCAFW